jgi:ribosome maturation protein Sdo1
MTDEQVKEVLKGLSKLSEIELKQTEILMLTTISQSLARIAEALENKGEL